MATRTIGDVVTTTTWSSSTATCTTAVPGKYGEVPLGSCNSKYPFEPNFDAHVAFSTLFGLCMLGQIAQAFLWKKRYCWVVIMGALWETFAFIMKSVGARRQQELAYVIVGQLFFLLAPLWVNAFVFMTIARIVYYVLPDQKLFRVRAVTLTKLLVWFDIVCFFIQAVGGSLMSDGDMENKVVRVGQYVYMGGCGAQLGFILVFIGMMTRLHWRMKKEGRPIPNMKQVHILLYAMFGVLGLIVIRIIFRLVEFGEGPTDDNEMLTNEYYAIGLDAIPMLLAFLLLSAVHPGWVLRGPDSEFPRLTRKERKQLKREKKEAKKADKEAKKEAKREAKETKDAARHAKKHGHSGKAPVESYSASRPSTGNFELLDRDEVGNVVDNRRRH